jgi:hypothetical protein
LLLINEKKSTNVCEFYEGFSMTKRKRITTEERNEALAAHDKLQGYIAKGEWEYSESQLRREFDCFRQLTWMEVHPTMVVVLILLFLPLGFIPVILYAILMVTFQKSRENYEKLLLQLKNNTLIKAKQEATTVSSSSTFVEEIGKLAELHKSGALNDDEFSTAKANIIKKSA